MEVIDETDWNTPSALNLFISAVKSSGRINVDLTARKKKHEIRYCLVGRE